MIPLFFIITCNVDTPYFDGSVGVYDDSERIFWATITTPNHQHIEDAVITLDTVYTITFKTENGGYYRDGISRLRYNSSHTIQADVEDNDIIYVTVEIPSSFGLDVESSINAGDSLMIGWTHADSMGTSPDRWRMRIVNSYSHDTTRYSFSKDENQYKVPSEVLYHNIEIIMDAIKYGEVSGARGGSVFVGVVRKSANVNVN